MDKAWNRGGVVGGGVGGLKLALPVRKYQAREF